MINKTKLFSIDSTELKNKLSFIKKVIGKGYVYLTKKDNLLYLTSKNEQKSIITRVKPKELDIKFSFGIDLDVLYRVCSNKKILHFYQQNSSIYFCDDKSYSGTIALVDYLKIDIKTKDINFIPINSLLPYLEKTKIDDIIGEESSTLSFLIRDRGVAVLSMYHAAYLEKDLDIKNEVNIPTDYLDIIKAIQKDSGGKKDNTINIGMSNNIIILSTGETLIGLQQIAEPRIGFDQIKKLKKCMYETKDFECIIDHKSLQSIVNSMYALYSDKHIHVNIKSEKTGLLLSMSTEKGTISDRVKISKKKYNRDVNIFIDYKILMNIIKKFDIDPVFRVYNGKIFNFNSDTKYYKLNYFAMSF